MALTPNKKITKKHVAAAASGMAAGTIILCATYLTHWEGEDPVAKHNGFDPKGVITVCNGYTNLDDPSLKAGMRFTHEECQKLLLVTIPDYAAPINKCIHAFKTWGPHRQIAWVSFGYNLGTGRVCGGTIGRLLKDGHVTAACEHMTDYEASAGRELPGLVRRREDGFWGERAWCLRED